MYTAGMPDEARADRVAELESDSWEHETQALERHERFWVQFLYRFVFGMPADIGWRLAQGRMGIDHRNRLQLLIACLITAGLFVALPVSALLLPNAESNLGGHAELSVIPVLDTMFVILLLVLPGVLVVDRWPVAGGFLVVIGCCCLMALYWWLPNAMAVIVLGAITGATSAVHLHHARRR